jgi:hypothetical protein
MMAIHCCGNGHLSCVNPAHLRWGTAKDNGKDAHLHNGPAHEAPEYQMEAINAHPLPKVAAVISGVTAETVRTARKR